MTPSIPDAYNAEWQIDRLETDSRLDVHQDAFRQCHAWC